MESAGKTTAYASIPVDLARTLDISQASDNYARVGPIILKNGGTQQCSQPWTVSSYLSMIMPALSACSSLGDVCASGTYIVAFWIDSSSRQRNPTSLVLFESRLGSIKLPVLKQPALNLAAMTGGSEAQASQHPLEQFVQKYFQLTCTFEDGQ
jgi:hypothetical protein